MEYSYGVIPLRRIKNRWETLLVKHGKGHWAFPKGHSDPEESPKVTASRELEEETALRISRFFPLEPLKELYHFKREGKLVKKTVVYYLAEVEGEVKIQEEEIEAFQWVSLEEAETLATFPESKSIARQAGEQLRIIHDLM